MRGDRPDAVLSYEREDHGALQHLHTEEWKIIDREGTCLRKFLLFNMNFEKVFTFLLDNFKKYNMVMHLTEVYPIYSGLVFDISLIETCSTSAAC